MGTKYMWSHLCGNTISKHTMYIVPSTTTGLKTKMLKYNFHGLEFQTLVNHLFFSFVFPFLQIVFFLFSFFFFSHNPKIDIFTNMLRYTKYQYDNSHFQTKIGYSAIVLYLFCCCQGVTSSECCQEIYIYDREYLSGFCISKTKLKLLLSVRM